MQCRPETLLLAREGFKQGIECEEVGALVTTIRVVLKVLTHNVNKLPCGRLFGNAQPFGNEGHQCVGNPHRISQEKKFVLISAMFQYRVTGMESSRRGTNSHGGDKQGRDDGFDHVATIARLVIERTDTRLSRIAIASVNPSDD